MALSLVDDELISASWLSLNLVEFALRMRKRTAAKSVFWGRRASKLSLEGSPAMASRAPPPEGSKQLAGGKRSVTTGRSPSHRRSASAHFSLNKQNKKLMPGALLHAYSPSKISP